MTTTIFLALLTTFATATAFLTQTLKKILDEYKIQYASNIVVLIVAIVVGIIGTSGYYVANAITFDYMNIAYIFLMGIANWLGAMFGYDKVKQAIEQLWSLKK